MILATLTTTSAKAAQFGAVPFSVTKRKPLPEQLPETFPRCRGSELGFSGNPSKRARGAWQVRIQRFTWKDEWHAT